MRPVFFIIFRVLSLSEDEESKSNMQHTVPLQFFAVRTDKVFEMTKGSYNSKWQIEVVRTLDQSPY